MKYPNANQRIDLHLRERKQVGIVYHWTTSLGAEGILLSNYIGANYEDRRDRGNVVSVTRDKSPNFWPYPSIFWRFSLDGDKISDRYKIRPYSDEESGNTRWADRPEAEEEITVPTRKLPLQPYFIALEWFGPWELSDLREYEVEIAVEGENFLAKEYGIGFEEYEGIQDAIDAVRAAQARGIKVTRGKGKKRTRL